MNRFQALLSAVLLPCLSVLVTSGCTLIGAGIGSLSDGPEDIETRHEVSYLYDLEPDERITVELSSGRTHTGIFRGFRNPTTVMLDDLLRSAKEHSPASTGASTLQCGDTVDVTLVDGSSYSALFNGCHISHVYLYHLSNSRHVSVAMLLLDELQRSDGKRFDGSSLSEALRRGDIPPVTSLLLETAGKIQTLPMKDVQGVTVLSRGHAGVVLGTLLGATCDILIVASLAGFQGLGF